MIHMFNDLSCFTNFQKTPQEEYLLAESSEVSILSYEDVVLQITKKNSVKKVLRLKNAVFCTDFAVNLVSFRLLKARGIYWNTINNTLFRESDSSVICILKKMYRQQVMEVNSQHTALAVHQVWWHQSISWMLWLVFKEDEALWHAWMRHTDLMSLHKLEINCLKVTLHRSLTIECRVCSLAKIH